MFRPLCVNLLTQPLSHLTHDSVFLYSDIALIMKTLFIRFSTNVLFSPDDQVLKCDDSLDAVSRFFCIQVTDDPSSETISRRVFLDLFLVSNLLNILTNNLARGSKNLEGQTLRISEDCV